MAKENDSKEIKKIVTKHENVPGQIQKVVFEINKEDYAANVEQALKRQRKIAQVPGFRVGNAPMGLVKKMYEKTLIAQEVDNLVNSNMDLFMKENEVKYIFEPLPLESESSVDFENGENFVFAYEYALAPEVNIDYAKLPKVVDFKMLPNEEERNNYINQLRERHGNYITPESIEANDSVSVKYGEDKDGFFFIRDLKEDAQKELVGKKVDENVTLSWRKAFATEQTLVRFLKLNDVKDLEEGNEYEYQATIKHIGRIEPAELNEAFFKKAYPDGSVNSEAELIAAADKVVLEQYQPELNRQFMNDAIEMLIDNVNVELPDEFIKRYILLTQKDMTAETLEEKYNDYQRAFKWQIIEGKLVEGEDVNVTVDDVKGYFRDFFVKNYFGGFNADDVKDRVEQLVNQSMENKEYVKNVYDMLFDEKLTVLLRSKLNIDRKEGDVKAFVDMLTARQKEIAGEPAKKTTKKKTTKKAETEAKEVKEEKEVKEVKKAKEPKAEKEAAPKAKKTTTKKTTKKEDK